MSFLTSRLLSGIPGVLHGFGTAVEPVPGCLRELWPTRASKDQVHGAVVVEATARGQHLGDADGIWTQVPGLAVAAVTADCVPVLLARRDGKRVAALHAGWRGTRARIVRSFWQDQQQSAGERAAEWLAAVGPAIGPCCYQVSEELAEGFARDFAGLLERARVLPAPRMLDLPAINEAELRDLGFGGVEVLRQCTRCTVDNDGRPRFASYRREGAGQRQFSAIAIAR